MLGRNVDNEEIFTCGILRSSFETIVELEVEHVLQFELTTPLSLSFPNDAAAPHPEKKKSNKPPVRATVRTKATVEWQVLNVKPYERHFEDPATGQH